MSENIPQTNSLYAKIEELLKSIPELVTEEKELRYNKIKEMAENGDAILLIPLMQNAEIKNAFFTPILDSFVFKTKEFKEFLDYSSSNNSYSQYLGKKIGLYCGDSALTDRNEVVLNFPFKDCVLEGGQKKEDGLDTYFEYDEKTGEYVKEESKRCEVFFNEILAKDEIDNLFSPKAFCNVKRYEKKNSEVEPVETSDFTRDAELNKKRGLSEDTITDNLIIKGNNLLALHSLKKEFEGKIKLIYIDPPYNTGSDGFSYNDNFNHSSWLTFMKNRLEVARDLLRDDGCIFVQCDDNEQAYLKVLMDEVFGRDNFIGVIIPIMNPRGRQEESYPFAKSHEYIILFSKIKDNALLFNLGKQKSDKEEEFRLLSLRKSGNASLRKDRPNMWYPIFYNENENKISTIKKEGYNIEIYPIKTSDKSEGRWRWQKNNVEENKELLVIKKNSEGIYDVYEKNFIVINGEFKGHKLNSFIKDTDIINDKAKEHLNSLFGDNVFSYPKSEILVRMILEFSSNPSDIVLDYHLGSGTTAAVAHKMNRQYIGVEQMDYIKTISCERLKKVIEGEQGGISKSVNWQGGGSFVYMELAEKNEKAMNLISACKNYDELVSIFNTLATKYFLHYNVRINDFINKTCKEEQFKNLSLEKQKEIFCRMLDLNQLYVNCDDRNDKDSGLSENDIKATENFYQIQKDGE